MSPLQLADIYALYMQRYLSHQLRADQGVMQHYLGLLNQAPALASDQLRITGAGTHQVHAPEGGVVGVG